MVSVEDEGVASVEDEGVVSVEDGNVDKIDSGIDRRWELDKVNEVSSADIVVPHVVTSSVIVILRCSRTCTTSCF